MHLLVLDDDQTRHEAFDRRCTSCDCVTHVYTVAEALTELQRRVFDSASLDHDLGRGPDGLAFITQMVALVPPDHWPAQIIVHTQNPAKGLRMTERLRDAGIPSQYVPFRP